MSVPTYRSPMTRNDDSPFMCEFSPMATKPEDRSSLPRRKLCPLSRPECRRRASTTSPPYVSNRALRQRACRFVDVAAFCDQRPDPIHLRPGGYAVEIKIGPEAQWVECCFHQRDLRARNTGRSLHWTCAAHRQNCVLSPQREVAVCPAPGKCRRTGRARRVPPARRGQLRKRRSLPARSQAARSLSASKARVPRGKPFLAHNHDEFDLGQPLRARRIKFGEPAIMRQAPAGRKDHRARRSGVCPLTG